MGRITVFTVDNCSTSRNTVNQLEKCGNGNVKINEVNLSRFPRRRGAMLLLSRGHKSVPQIFFNDIHMGGYEVIHALQQNGQLERLVAETTAGPEPREEGLRVPDEFDTDVKEADGMPTSFVSQQTRDHELYYERLMTLVKHTETGVPIATRMYQMKQHQKCFVGFEMVDWLIANVDPSLSREEAVRRGQIMMDAGVFNHVGRVEPFRDAYVLYRFQEDEELDILNMKYIFSGQAPSADEQSKRLCRVMKDLVAFYSSEAGTDYESIANSAEWRTYLRITTELQRMDMLTLDRCERLAFVVNIFNGLAIHALLSSGHPKNASERTAFANNFAYSIGGLVYSLNDLHHGLLRGNQVAPGTLKKPFASSDPRRLCIITPPFPLATFALSMGCRSNPPLRAFTPEHIEQDLKIHSIVYLSQSIHLNTLTGEAMLPLVLKRFLKDFANSEWELLGWLRTMLPPTMLGDLEKLLKVEGRSIKYWPFDYSSNACIRPVNRPISEMSPLAGSSALHGTTTRMLNTPQGAAAELLLELELEKSRARNTELALESALTESRKKVSTFENQLKKMEAKIDRLERPAYPRPGSVDTGLLMPIGSPYVSDSQGRWGTTTYPMPHRLNQYGNYPSAADHVMLPPVTNKRSMVTGGGMRGGRPAAAMTPIDVTTDGTAMSAQWKSFATFTIPLGFLTHLKQSFIKADTFHVGYLDANQLAQWAAAQGMQNMTPEKANKMIQQVDLTGMGRVSFWAFLAIQSYLILGLQKSYNLREWLAFVTQGAH